MPDLEATGALPPDEAPRDLQAELEAEFTDHLALVARDEMLRGRSAVEAQEKANERFGDLTQIERQCRWVHQGDAVMLRTVMIGGLVVLALALGYSTWTSRQGQADLRQQLAAVTAKLEAMAETQPPPTTGTISGVAYLGDKLKPAAGVEIKLLKAPQQDVRTTIPFPDWIIERRMLTDAEGRFEFKVLSPETYSILSSLVSISQDGDHDITTCAVQSEPQPLGPGDKLDVPLDLSFRGGNIRLALTKPLPGPFKTDHGEFSLSLYGNITQAHRVPLRPSIRLNSGLQWPMRGYSRHDEDTSLKVPLHFYPGGWFRHGELNRSFATRAGWGQDIPEVDPVKLDPTALHTIFPYETGSESKRPWLATQYMVEFYLMIVDDNKDALSLADPNWGRLGDLRGRAGFTLDRKIQFFFVADGQTTDLRVIVPDEITTWGEDIAKLWSSSHLLAARPQPPLSFFFRRSPMRDDDVEFAKLLNHAFEIEVTGPHSPE